MVEYELVGTELVLSPHECEDDWSRTVLSILNEMESIQFNQCPECKKIEEVIFDRVSRKTQIRYHVKGESGWDKIMGEVKRVIGEM